MPPAAALDPIYSRPPSGIGPADTPSASSSQASQPAEVRVWMAFCLLSIIWGSSYLFIRVGARQLSPESLVFLRLFVGSVVIGAIVVVRHASIRANATTLGLLAIQGTINTAVPFVLIASGEVHVPSGLAAVLNGTVPIFGMLLGRSVPPRRALIGEAARRRSHGLPGRRDPYKQESFLQPVQLSLARR